MTLILVDASFNSFYRFFATMRWYSLSKKEDFKKYKANPNYDWYENIEFMEKYEKMYFESFENLLTRKIVYNSTVIFCEDAPQETLWRHKLIKSKHLQDQYKGERPDLKSKYNFKNVFDYTYKKMIPNAKKEKPYPIHQLKLPETEADDIIASICIYMKKHNFNEEIIIVSGDDDFTQLGRENVSILNYHKKKLIKFDNEECEDKLRLKIINGDKSDNIPSIFPKSRKEVSLKTRKLVKESISAMNEFFENNPEIKSKFKLNEKLIDFNKIPKKIQTPVIKKFKKIEI
ncbi:putative RNaseH [Cafeteria roenbergensis virus]|uniref:Putative RNaseH n=1 Tax=Cafeteria roenbergensis virus (strain BV-PW1) TaxID=693272 RepID=E3T4D1_CROVB|nr:putative RNaseH [Cafeteria roenbergensis virus BV-PW1]ADO67044.1 putative RNaseH [Cafeteria roenbergensis virus BV-PW1]